MSSKSLALAAGAAGLAGGLALGITGFASAADPTPTPGPGSDTRSELRMDKRAAEGMKKERGLMHKRGHHQRGAGGLVQSVGASSLTVLTRDGVKTIALNGDTSFYVGKTKATRSAVKEGVVVHVRLVDPRADEQVAAVVHVVPAHVSGWVTDVEGSTVTITDLSGFTRKVRTDGDTTYVKDGAAATSSIVTEGALIHARGEVADDGTTLEADRIGVGRPDVKDRERPAEPNA